MKFGTIELTQGAVVYIILMLVVVFVAIAIVLKVNPLTLLRQRELSGLFEPGKLSIEGELSVDCRSVGSQLFFRDLTVKNARFDFIDPDAKEGDQLQFFLLFEFNNRLFYGEKSDATNTFLCKKEGEVNFNCGEPTDIVFKISTDQVASKDLVHLTAWRATAGVSGIVNGPEPTFSKLLDEYFDMYLGSVDLADKQVTLDDVCYENICKQLPQGACESEPACEWIPSIFGGECGFRGVI